jgi:tetratricopeptide (TPR) repeat protein
MSKQKKKRTDRSKPAISKTPLKNRQNRLFVWIIVIFTFALYGNTINNHYSLDDYHIAPESEEIRDGIKAIPEIFVTVYAMEREATYSYRPLVRASFALEYWIFGPESPVGKTLQTLAAGMGLAPGGNYDITPHIGHFFNVIFYLIAVLLLFKILKRLFRNYHAWFPFIVTLIFIAHPIHTEIVASLKNRDELLALIFAFLSLIQLLKYADYRKQKHLIYTIVFMILAVISKETFAAFFTIYPFTLYFFTDLGHRKTAIVTGILLLIGVAAVFAPFLFIPFYDRPIRLEENPLPFNDTFFNRIAYGAYTLYYYFRLMVFPHPLLYYYGYNMFPIVSMGNPLVILSLIFHLGLFIVAIRKFKEKHILSYSILIYLGTLAMFTNAVYPAPGIIAERFLTYPSIGFSIALGYGIYRLLLVKPRMIEMARLKLTYILLVLVIILIPYSAKTITRNQDWKTELTLYSADMRFLYNSVKANDLYANEIMEMVNRELSKPVDVLKFVEPQIRESLSHYKRSIEIQPSYYSAWNSVGIIYSRIYKEYDTALYYFNEALRLKPKHPQTHFNLAQAYEGKGEAEKALYHYEFNMELDPTAISAYSRAANIYYRQGDFKRAIELNQEITKIDEEEPLPYINIGNYYVFQGDTTKGVNFYEQAIELGAPAVASEFVSKYYRSIGDQGKAAYYERQAEKARKEGRYYTP